MKFTKGVDYQEVSSEIALKQRFHGHIFLFGDACARRVIKDCYVIFLREFTRDEMIKCCESVRLGRVSGVKMKYIHIGELESQE